MCYTAGMELQRLVEIMAALRGPNGCPWDRAQTRESLQPFLIEEAYEVIEAIDEGNPGKIQEELGDLLFQIVFHAQIGMERGEFDIEGVIGQIGRKMISRHPHVFEGGKCATPEEVVTQWEEIKRSEGKLRDSALEGVPRELPSLLRAHRIQDRASRVGFDWQRVDDVVKKLDEEVGEFKDALAGESAAEIEEELGDIFFALVNIARFVGVNPEDALRKTISKFIKRFRYVEMRAAELGRQLSEMSLEEMDALWEESKGPR